MQVVVTTETLIRSALWLALFAYLAGVLTGITQSQSEPAKSPMVADTVATSSVWGLCERP